MAVLLKIKDTEVHVGDLVSLTQTFKEGDKERSQIFQGTVMAIKGRNVNQMVKLRKISIDGIGVEKTFPVFSPTIVKVVVKKKGHPRRAKLYYLRKSESK